MAQPELRSLAFLSSSERRVSHTAPRPRVKAPVPAFQFQGAYIVSTTNGGPAGTPNPNITNPAPQLMVLAQYVKDLSFENPNAPRTFNQNVQPQINVQVNVNVTPITQTDVEVALKLEAKAEAAGTVLFDIELVFAGAFRIQNVPQENLHPLMMIECPRLLFPFAREIVASAVRNGGFPPLLLDPIDFVSLYQQNMAQLQTQGGAPQPAKS